MVVVHKLANRVRIKLSHPLKKVTEAQDMIKEHEGVEKVSYNPVTRSIIVYFNEFKIDVEEGIIRVALVYSKDYNFVPVSLVSTYPKKELHILSYYSILAIMGAWISKYTPPLAHIQDFVNWLAVGMTIGAIGEHAYSEINEKGTVDPEVMSVLYLINSIQKGNFLSATTITWLATFGRHIIKPSYDKVILRSKEVRDICSGEVYYNVSVVPDNHSKGKIGFLSEFVSHFIEKEKMKFGSTISVTKNGINNMNSRSYCGFSSVCKAINVSYG